MTQMLKRSLAWLMVLLMCLSLISVFGMDIHAASSTVNYKKDGNYVYNWGKREEAATFLSPMALDFYKKYNVTLDGLSGFSGGTSQSNVPSSALYKELQRLMKQAHSHETNYGETRPLYKYTDCENNGNVISSFYSGVSIGPAWDGGSTWNREHTWPNSKGLAGNDENDIMMLRPTASSENFSRGNKAYGKSSGYYFPNSESDGTHDVRGDVARIFLYIYVRWGNTTYAWGTSGVMESSAVLLEWMEADPVDTWEMGRNDSVQSITGTRNMFVDYPELAFVLFGKDVPSGMTTPSNSTQGPGTSGCEHAYDNSCDTSCNLCGAVRVVVHVYDGGCDTDCNVCGATREAGKHSYKFYCSSSCSICGATREAKHIGSGWQVIVEATEEKAGLEKGTCIYCKSEIEREIPRIGDTGEEKPDNPPVGDPNCKHSYKNYCDSSCSKCGAVRDAKHLYSGWQVVTEATVEAPGVERGACIYCKATTEREIPQLTPPVEDEPTAPPSSENPDTPTDTDTDTEEESQGFFAAIAEFFRKIFEWIASLFE